MPETGVTIHIVDEEVDHGPILAQESVKREPEDTIETLEAKIHAVEHKLYKKTLKEFFAKNPANPKWRLRMGQDRRARARQGARGPRIRNSVQLGNREIS